MPIFRDFTGATGLEPATSGVTGRARANTILHPKARKSPISRDFVRIGGRGVHALPSGFRTVPPHPDPIATSPVVSTRRHAHLRTHDWPALPLRSPEPRRSPSRRRASRFTVHRRVSVGSSQACSKQRLATQPRRCRDTRLRLRRHGVPVVDPRLARTVRRIR
jgi:hypothetical protein